jgi:hypothetical protein
MPGKIDSSSTRQKSTRRRIPKWALHSNNGASNERYYLRSIGRALDVLDCFDGKTPLTLKEIGKSTGLPDSTLFRVLLTLEKHSYRSQAMDGAYQLAPKLRVGWLIGQANALRDKVRPELERLAQRFNETASMAYLYEDRIHVLDSIETFHEIRMSNRIGRVLPPHCSALGKAITAFQDRTIAEQIVEIYGLSRRTDRTITDRTVANSSEAVNNNPLSATFNPDIQPNGENYRTFTQYLLRQDYTSDWDANVQKDITTWENVQVQLRLDAFNLLNRPQYGTPNVSPTSSSFGTSSGVYSGIFARQFQVGARIAF